MTKEEASELRARMDASMQAKLELYAAECRMLEADTKLNNYLYELQNPKKEQS